MVGEFSELILRRRRGTGGQGESYKTGIDSQRDSVLALLALCGGGVGE